MDTEHTEPNHECPTHRLVIEFCASDVDAASFYNSMSRVMDNVYLVYAAAGVSLSAINLDHR